MPVMKHGWLTLPVCLEKSNEIWEEFVLVLWIIIYQKKKKKNFNWGKKIIAVKILENHGKCQTYCFTDGLCTCFTPLTNPYIPFSLKTDTGLGMVAEMHFRATGFCTWSASWLADQWREWLPSVCFWADPKTNFSDCWHNTEAVVPAVQKVGCPSLWREVNAFPPPPHF